MGGSPQRGRRRRGPAARAVRSTDHYRRPRNPFPPQHVLSDDEVAHIHDTAVRFLQEHGIRILLPEARDLFEGGGAKVGDDSDERMVRIPVEMVAAALESVPSEFSIRARNPGRSVSLGSGETVFLPVAGPPFVSDLDRGRRAGTLEDFENFVKLTQSYDVLHGLTPSAEAQDIAIDIRHLLTTQAAMRLSDKVMFVYSRGRGRVADAFAIMRIVHELDEETFADTPVCWTVINTNSPRQIDVPMCLGIIDFARAGQVSVLTPFTLAGAMAPVSLAGALLLQHLEGLAAITLSQLARPGAPVVYGAFTSNVDMKSGSPAFGTPEAIKSGIASGQLARHIGIPWRSSGSSASTVEDAQGAYETMLNLSGALGGGADMIVHSAGWQEGGLCSSYEKLIMDVELLQILVESWQPVVIDDEELAYDAIAGVSPGGHFFGEEHTMSRFETAFYEPILFTRQNYEQWTEGGSLDARQRANAVWKERLESFEPPPMDDAVAVELDDFVDRRISEGGAPVD